MVFSIWIVSGIKFALDYLKRFPPVWEIAAFLGIPLLILFWVTQVDTWYNRVDQSKNHEYDQKLNLFLDEIPHPALVVISNTTWRDFLHYKVFGERRVCPVEVYMVNNVGSGATEKILNYYKFRNELYTDNGMKLPPKIKVVISDQQIGEFESKGVTVKRKHFCVNSVSQFIESLPPNTIVCLAVKDEASRNFTPEAQEALKTLGLQFELLNKWRWSYAAVGIKGVGRLPRKIQSQ